MSGPIPTGNGGTNASSYTASKILMTASDQSFTSADANNLTISTYTPTMGDGTNNFSVNSAIGQYIQTGSLIRGSATINWNGKGSASSGSQLKISLPATLGANCNRSCLSLGFVSGIGFTGNMICGTATTATNYATLFGFSGGTAFSVTVSQCGTSGELQYEFLFWTN